MTDRKRHHHRQRQTRPHRHLRLAPDEVPFESEAVVYPGVDALYGVAAPVSAMPRHAAAGCGSKNTTVTLKRDAHNPAVTAGFAARVIVTLLPPLAPKTVRRCGVFVVAVSPRLPKSVDNVCVGQGVKYETKTVEVGETVDLFPAKW